MKLKAVKILLAVATALAFAAAVVFGFDGIIPYNDKLLGKLVAETVPRLAMGIILIFWLLYAEFGKGLKPRLHGFGKSLLWSLPCFAVAVANFPFSALISGAAAVERADLIWLLLLKCFSIALMEEIFFRAILLPVVLEKLNGKNKKFLAVIISSAVFAAAHLLNLFFGAGIGAVALQVAYSFLLGCMFAVMLLKTDNVWLCVAVHFLFDIGGMLVMDLGSGNFQNTAFWITIVAVGTLTSAHILFALAKINRGGEDA